MIKVQLGAYAMVLIKFPEMRGKALQNIVDQRRSLMLNRKMPEEIVSEIRREVKEELRLPIEENLQQQPTMEDRTSESVAITEVRQCFMHTQKLYDGLDPICKPILRKLMLIYITNHLTE